MATHHNVLSYYLCKTIEFTRHINVSPVTLSYRSLTDEIMAQPWTSQGTRQLNGLIIYERYRPITLYKLWDYIHFDLASFTRRDVSFRSLTCSKGTKGRE